MDRLTFGVANAKFEAGTFSGRVHAYGTVTIDGRKQGFLPGIFSKSIAAGNIRAYWGHSVMKADGGYQSMFRLGSQKAGTLQLADTGQVVDFAVKPPDTTYARDLKAMVDSGEEIGVSFEFYPGKFERRGDVKVWTDGRLAQINFVEDPAFEGTGVVLNSVQAESVISQTVKIRARALVKM